MSSSLPITRRDFLEGVALTLGAPLPAAAAWGGQTDDEATAAHALRDHPEAARQAVAERDEGTEDLVVVGAGLGGLAGAWLYRQHAGRRVRILMLDALAEVGGHARRNEFVARSGRRLVGYGGSQSLDSPGLWSAAARAVVEGVGIDLARFKTGFFDTGWRRRMGLVNQADYFAAANRLVLRRAGETPADALPRMPLAADAQAALRRLWGPPVNVLPALRGHALRAHLAAISYRAFLLGPWRLPPAAADFYRHATAGYFGVGIEATSALDAWAAGLPGFGGLALGDGVDARQSPSGRQLKAGEDDYVYHFPDGNHGVVRALLRALRPELVPGQGMETLSSAAVDAARFDDPAADVRVRLRATVTGLRHLGPPGTAELVELRYADAAGRVRAVRARHILLACWHRVIPHLTDELPAAQVRALRDQVKVPLVYATALLNNWRAWQAAGVAAIGTPDGFWQDVALDFPVSLGDLRFPQGADEPILLHLGRVCVPFDGRDPRTQSAAGRRELLATPYERFERETVALLDGALGAFGFDAARDLEALTVNRWAHGYTYEYMRPWDRFWPAGPLPVATARRGWGRVAIAGADSGAFAYAHSAFDQATRAVQELLPAARLPAWAAVPGPDPKVIGL